MNSSKLFIIVLICFVYVLGAVTGYSYSKAEDAKIKFDQDVHNNSKTYVYGNITVDWNKINISDKNITVISSP